MPLENNILQESKILSLLSNTWNIISCLRFCLITHAEIFPNREGKNFEEKKLFFFLNSHFLSKYVFTLRCDYNKKTLDHINASISAFRLNSDSLIRTKFYWNKWPTVTVKHSNHSYCSCYLNFYKNIIWLTFRVQVSFSVRMSAAFVNFYLTLDLTLLFPL